MHIYLFEDPRIANLYPVTLTRHGAAVKVGSWSLLDLVSHATGSGLGSVSLFCRPHLRATAARTIQSPDLPYRPDGKEPSLWVNASLWPDPRLVPVLERLIKKPEPCLVQIQGRVALACIPAHQGPDHLASWEEIGTCLQSLDLPSAEFPELRLLEYPFHLIEAQKDLVVRSLEYRLGRGGYTELYGAHKGVWVAPGVDVPQLTAFRTADGPVILDEGVSVLDFCFFRGPVYLGPGTKVIEHASVKDGVSTGHTCKIGGEIECAVMDSYSNKQHHGFLGHAFIGSWVNLGAGTSNSDLKNTYGSIQITHQGQRLDTKLQFFGCIMGDYSKTAINTSIFTGKIIGVSSMLYGFVGQNVPSFTNYANSFGQITECDLQQAIRTQQRMFSRRKIEQLPPDVQLLKDVFDLTRDERRISTDPLVL